MKREESPAHYSTTPLLQSPRSALGIRLKPAKINHDERNHDGINDSTRDRQ